MIALVVMGCVYVPPIGQVGEEEFSLLFHKGKKENIHFSRVAEDFLMVSIFGNEVSLGFLRLKVAETIKNIKSILESSMES